MFGPDMIEEAEKQVKVIQERLKIAQSRQKSYSDKRHQDLSFSIGDAVYLKVSPLRGMRRFGIKGKLAPRYIGPFVITARRGEVAYQLELPEKLSNVHNVFHVSQLKKCFKRPEEEAQKTSLEEIEVQDDLTYDEYPIRILDEKVRTTRRNVIKFCKVQWSNHSEEEATWEREDDLKAEFPHLFLSSESRGRDSL